MTHPDYIKPKLDEKTETRFWDKVKKASITECWIWVGCVNTKGYGHLGINGKTVLANRICYYLFYKIDPGKQCVLHECDNPICVNPHHLFLGTRKDNAADMVAKGRQAKGNKNGAYTKPEKVPRGDKHWSRRYPEKISRGSNRYNAKLSEPKVTEIMNVIKEKGKYYGVVSELSRLYDVSCKTIREVINGRTWRHVEIPHTDK